MSMSNRPAQPSIGSLLDTASSDPQWTDSDLAAMFRHQLSVPLEPGQTIGEVLERGTIEQLQSLKRIAKVNRARAESGVPSDLWRVIYFATIVGARRAGISISDLSDDDLRRGCEWVAARPWVDGSIRSIMLGACSSMKQEST